MDRPYDSRDLAAYIAQQCETRKIKYNRIKIQKILFCLYGVMLAWKGIAICDEKPRCWPNGPIFLKVFEYINKGGQIDCYSHVIEESKDADIKEAVWETLDTLRPYTASVLSNWSHDKDSPWDRTRIESDGKWNDEISNAHILEYFQSEISSKKQ